MTDTLYVAALNNSNKKHFLTIDERLSILHNEFDSVENIKIVTFDGLLANFCEANKVDVIIKGLRNSEDFQLELDMAQAIKAISDVETIFLPTDIKYSFFSSKIVRDLVNSSNEYNKLDVFVTSYTKEIIKNRRDK